MKPGYKVLTVTNSLTSREGFRESGGSGRVPIAEIMHFFPKNDPLPADPPPGGVGGGGYPGGVVGSGDPPSPRGATLGGFLGNKNHNFQNSREYIIFTDSAATR